MKQKTITLLLTGLLLFTLIEGGDQPAGADSNETGAQAPARSGGTENLALATWSVTGSLESGFGTLNDTREFYNRADQAIAVAYLFYVPDNAQIIQLRVSSDGNDYVLEENTADPTTAEIIADDHTGQYRYLDAVAGLAYLDELVKDQGDPSLLSLHGSRLLLVNFPVPANGFVTVMVEYTQPAMSEGGLQKLPLMLSPWKAFEMGGGPMERNSVEGLVEVKLSSVHSLEGVYSPTHALQTTRLDRNTVNLLWQGTSTTGEVMEVFYTELTASFGGGLLNYRLGGRTMFQEGEDGYFMFLFAPNTDEFATQAMPKDIVFVLDTSGSMSGDKLVQAKHALNEVLAHLNPTDRFTIVRFSSDVSVYDDELKETNEGELNAVRAYVDSLRASGSTNIDGALAKALDPDRKY